MSQYYDDGNYPILPEHFDTFEAADDALYNHERAYYYHAARGAVDGEFSPAWHKRRDELQREWNSHARGQRLGAWRKRDKPKTMWERFKNSGWLTKGGIK